MIFVEFEQNITLSAPPYTGDDLYRAILAPCNKLFYISLAFNLLHSVLLITKN